MLIEFRDLKWTTFGINTVITMSFSTLMQHNEGSSAVTHRVNVENIASSIDFIKDPPREVSINDIFPIEVRVSTKGGYPLPNTRVSCNVTKAMDLSKMSSEVFTSLANSNFNIQKSSLLAPGSELDPDRTSTKSDNYGVAKLYLRVKQSPLDSKVRIVCQSGSAMSTPSTTIKITHPVRKITQSRNYTENVKVIFQKDSEGYKSKS